MKRSRTAAALVLTAILLAGCGGGGMLKPKGRVVQGGTAFTIKEGADLGVFFYPLDADGKLGKTVYPAYFNASDGTFTVTGSDKRGLPPGKYRVVVEHKLNKKDLFNGTYDMNRSPFVFDVDTNTAEIVIDLDKKS